MNFTGNDAIMFFLLHLLGDYILQTDWMAINKTKRMYPAFVHGFVYSVPFYIAFHPSWNAWLTICFSHVLIDRYRLARFVVYAKNKLGNLGNPLMTWYKCDQTGYPNSMAPWMSVWLLIIADNTIHLLINYLSLRYL